MLHQFSMHHPKVFKNQKSSVFPDEAVEIRDLFPSKPGSVNIILQDINFMVIKF